MAIISELLNEPEFKQLNLIAGEKGVGRSFSGINVVESPDLVPFCRPNELIVTTGIQMKNDVGQLEKLVSKAFEKKVAGFIINVGPYIPAIPNTIIQFANEHDFPILQMGWKHRIADLLKHTFAFISSTQQTQYFKQTDETLLYQLIFRYGQHHHTLHHQLQQRGFSNGAELCIITCTPTTPETNINRFSAVIQYELQKYSNSFLKLNHQNQLIFLVNRTNVSTDHIPFSKVIDKIYEKIGYTDGKLQLIIGIGNSYNTLNHISKSYEESLTVIHLVKKNQSPFIHKYKEIGAYNIIKNVTDQSITQQFHQDMLGPLYMYDHLHNTDYVKFLRSYLEESGSTSKISKKLFIHRNTVAYKIRKIESLLDVDLNNTFTRTNLYVAFMIEDIMSQKLLRQ